LRRTTINNKLSESKEGNTWEETKTATTRRN